MEAQVVMTCSQLVGSGLGFGFIQTVSKGCMLKLHASSSRASQAACGCTHGDVDSRSPGGRTLTSPDPMI